jgi:hypothetical protein
MYMFICTGFVSIHNRSAANMYLPAILVSSESMEASALFEPPSSSTEAMSDIPRTEEINGNSRPKGRDRAISQSSSFIDMNRWQANMGLKTFGQSLHAAAQALFPNQNRSRYSKVYVLLVRWETEPELTVSKDLSRLYDVFNNVYHFNTSVWKISDEVSQAEADQKIAEFVNLGDNSEDALKIICYAGNCLHTESKGLAWTR